MTEKGNKYTWIIGVLPLVAGLGILGWQCLDWLQSGSWTPMPISRLVGHLPPIRPGDWLGFRKICEFVLDMHLLFVGVVAFWFWVHSLD